MRSRSISDRVILGSASAWALTFWIACVGVPIFAVLSRVSSWEALRDPGVLNIARMTFFQAAISTALASVMGFPLGLWVGRAAIAERRWAQAVLALPFGVPSVVAGLAWVVILGRAGVFSGLNWAYSMKAVVLAHVVFNVPWIALWVAQARSFQPTTLSEVARTLGGDRTAIFFTVTWPHTRWAFFSSACQAFVFCAMSFALVLILGGGPPVQTLEVALYASVRYGDLDLSRAASCAVWELLITLLPWACVVYSQVRSGSFSVRARQDWEESVNRTATSRWGFGSMLAICAFFFIPYLAVLGNRTAGNSSEPPLWLEVIPAFRVSLTLALATAFAAIATAVSSVVAVESVPQDRARLKGFLAFLFSMPSGISALVLGLGIWLAYERWIDPFSGSYLAIIALQTAIFFPIAFRVFWPVVRERPVHLIEAAELLGASRAGAFWVIEWPRWKAPLLSALGMVAGASLGEVAAASLFYSEKIIPLPLLISRWSSQYRFHDAQTVAAVLLFLCAVLSSLPSLGPSLGMILSSRLFRLSFARPGARSGGHP